MSTYEEFSQENASQKIALAKIEAAKRLVGWSVYSGTVYVLDFDESVIVSLRDSGIDLSVVGDVASVIPGAYFLDRAANKVYLETTDSVDPNTKFISVTFFLFFSNRPINAPHDLVDGFEVCWLPYISSVSQFKLELDNRDINLGNAIEGKGSITLLNDNEFWNSRFDKLVFENKLAFVYSYNLALDITEAKLIFRGRIQQKSYSDRAISFSLRDALNELREPFVQASLGEVNYTHGKFGSIPASVPDNFSQARQRSIYGRPNGVRLPSIDQNTGEYPIRGTVTATFNSTTVGSGGGTSFFQDLAQGDEVRFASQPDKTYRVVDFVSAANTFSIEEPYNSSTTGTTLTIVKSEFPMDRMDRHYFICEHNLTAIATTVTEAFTARRFRVADASNLSVGDSIVISGQTQVINAILGGNVIETVISFAFLPVPPNPVARSAVRSLYLDGNRAIENTDFDINETEKTLFLRRGTSSPEFRFSPVFGSLTGSLTFGAGNIAVTGVGTLFTSELVVGDFIDGPSALYHQVIAIVSDTSLKISAGPGAGGIFATPFFRRPAYLTDNSKITADMIGKPLGDITTNPELIRGPAIVKDILEKIAVSAAIEPTSFDDSDILAPHDIGISIPGSYTATKSIAVRDIINQINRSIFGSLFQNSDFALEYGLLNPARSAGNQKLRRVDVISWDIRNDARDIVSKVNLSYNVKEINELSQQPSEVIESATSDIAKFLAETNKEFNVDTVLVDPRSARIFATRWAFLLEIARGLVRLNLKLQAQTSDIVDKITFEHPGMYERVGSRFKTKIGLVSSVERSVDNTSITFDDLANAFSRCGAIAENGSRTFDTSTEEELLLYGYITDDNGMINNDPETFGINLIW